MKILLSLEKPEHFRIAEKVTDYVDGFKVNHIMWDWLASSRFDEFAKLESFALKREKEYFFDCKLWDTPNTVETVVKKIIQRGGTMTSICAHNSHDVFEKLQKLSDQIKLVGVVSLTSWDYEAERAILRDVSYNVWQQSMNKLRRYNFQDLVCPVTELRTIKSLDLSGPNSFRYICPGIVFEKQTSGQTRTGTPREAKEAGADYIVLGRTVTEAENPNDVLVKIKGTL